MQIYKYPYVRLHVPLFPQNATGLTVCAFLNGNLGRDIDQEVERQTLALLAGKNVPIDYFLD